MSTGEVDIDPKAPGVPDHAAIVFLTQRNRVPDMLKAIASVDHFVREKFQYPVVIFWDDLQPDDIAAIRKSSKYPIHFEKVDFQHAQCNEEFASSPHWAPFGYRQMCRFWTFPVMRTKLLEKAKYYWRVDTDALITDPVLNDPFKEMEATGDVYGTRRWLTKGNDCKTGVLTDLDRLSRCFLDKHSAAKSNPTAWLQEYVDTQGKWKQCWGLETNFEIVDTRFFGSQAAEDYWNLIDSTGGFLKYRWGDAHTRSETLALLGDRKRIKCFGDIGYKHKSHQFQAAACEIPESMTALEKYFATD
jgi:hypothetical protein